MVALLTTDVFNKLKRKCGQIRSLLKGKKSSHTSLFRELDCDDFQNHLRMNHDSLIELYLVSPLRSKLNTITREAGC